MAQNSPYPFFGYTTTEAARLLTSVITASCIRMLTLAKAVLS
jgi:hypothetical protein